MSDPLLPLQIGDIARADFRTSFHADTVNASIQKKFAFQFKYQPARLALALSLRIPTPPDAPADTSGRPIKGDFLFGSDEAELSAWVALIVQHAGGMDLTRKMFQALVSAHWARGTAKLGGIADELPAEPETLVALLAERFDIA
ncbi:hypothetical protein GCM10007913_40060 [Devosia yakushimensis]|uniref:DUF1832 domain-containing protein n=1 Tax=Devosia yakushimensis TaxID=470028 RepID=A0ABQ5UKB9_9HYPH|nr:hypothetical protein [Devosia yakushimensis]GLQ12074.1 hypothetical protein GCM10007913_40060 [Devosia yakushimensis]